MEYFPSANSSSVSPNLLLINENMRLQSENFSLKAQISELEHELNQEKCKVFARDEKVKQLTEAWSQCCDEVNELTRRNSMLRESTDSYEIQHQQQLAIAHANHDKLNSTCIRLAEVEELLKDKEETIRNLLARRNPDTLSNLNDVKAKLQETKRKLQIAHVDLGEQLLIARRHRKEIAVIKKDLEAKDKDLLKKNATLTSLEATLSRVTKKNNEQKRQLKKSEKMMKILKSDKQLVRIELLKCNRNLETQLKLNADLRTQLTQIDFTTVENFQEAEDNQEYQLNEQHVGMDAMQNEMLCMFP